MPAHPAMLQLSPEQSCQSGSHPGAPAFCEPFTGLVNEATAGADTYASCDTKVSNPGTTLTCFSLSVCMSSVISSTRKRTLTGFDPFRSFCFSYCGNMYLWQEKVWGTTGLPSWHSQPCASTEHSASRVEQLLAAARNVCPVPLSVQAAWASSA